MLSFIFNGTPGDSPETVDPGKMLFAKNDCRNALESERDIVVGRFGWGRLRGGGPGGP